MITIFKDKVYELESFKFYNYIDLSLDEKRLILDMRNNPKVSGKMLNSAKISLEDHLSFIDQLNDRNDVFYWLIKKDGQPIGSFNVKILDTEKSIIDTGVFVFNTESEMKMLVNMFDISLAYHRLIFEQFNVKQINGEVANENLFVKQMDSFIGYKETNSDDKFTYIVLTESNFSKQDLSELTYKRFMKYYRENLIKH